MDNYASNHYNNLDYKNLGANMLKQLDFILFYRKMDYKRTVGKAIEPHLKDQASFLSHFLFCWQLKILYRRWKKKSPDNDFSTPLKKLESKKLGDRLEKSWIFEKNFRKTPSLSRALVKTFGLEYILYGVVYFVLNVSVTLLQSLCLAKLLDSLSQPNVVQDDIFFYGSVVITLAFIKVYFDNFIYLELSAFGLKIRIACCSLLYRNILKLKKTTIQKHSFGQIVNLLTNDVERFDVAFRFMHFAWMVPATIIIASCFLYFIFDASVVTGMGAILVVFVIQVYVLRKITFGRRKTTAKTDNRINLMNEIVCKIQTIKMFAWENVFKGLVDNARRSEMTEIRKTIFFRLINLSFGVWLGKACVFLCVLAAVLGRFQLKSYYIFVLTYIYEILNIASETFGYVISYIADIRVSIKRMQEVLLAETETCQILNLNQDLDNKIRVSVDKISVKWQSSPTNTLNGVNVEASSSELVAIVGSAGSGKSTLLQAILKEVDVVSGNMSVRGSVSYAPQKPWIFLATLRQNILFGEDMDEKRYLEVIKLCALDQDLSLLSHSDNTLVGERGVRLSGGQRARIGLARAVYRNADVYLIDDPFSSLDGQVANHIFNECILGFLKEKCVILVTNQTQFLENVDRTYVLDEGKVVASGRYEDVRGLVKNSANKTLKNVTRRSKPIQKCETPKEVEEYSGKAAINSYKHFLINEGRWKTSSIFLFLFLVAELLICGNNYFLSFWINEKQSTQFEFSPSDTYFLSIYSTLTAAIILTIYLCIIFVKKHCSLSSKHLHDTFFDTILLGSMKFFNDHLSGRILNRFSRDTGIVDELVPSSLFDFLRLALTVIATAITIVISNYWMLVPTVLMYGLFYVYTLMFVPAINDFKRIEKTRSSPICNHVSASLEGLLVIRASKAQDFVQLEFDNYQDSHSSVYYLHQALRSAFGFWIDFTCALYSTVVIYFLSIFYNEVPLGNFGLIVAESIKMVDNIQYCMKQWSTLDSQMTSVERVVEFQDLTTENDDQNFVFPKMWPENGEIVYKSVSLQYSPEKPFVLKNISVAIHPGEKIGIVGRTGAGKSSLVSVLFRLFDFQGNVYIDGADTKTLPLRHLRSKIAVIPQEPVLFTGTLRQNLDPFGDFTDCQLWCALEDVELKSFVSRLSSGLDTEISDDDSGFSVGQKQLFCLVRAILKNSKIVVLDEATANVDLKTDALIQEVLKRRFRNSTVLTIAHRLDTVVNSDRIMVMDSGSVIEFGAVEELLRNDDGYFYKYYRQQSNDDNKKIE